MLCGIILYFFKQNAYLHTKIFYVYLFRTLRAFGAHIHLLRNTGFCFMKFPFAFISNAFDCSTFLNAWLQRYCMLLAVDKQSTPYQVIAALWRISKMAFTFGVSRQFYTEPESFFHSFSKQSFPKHRSICIPMKSSAFSSDFLAAL